uniref:Uncharacterized protein n=1 Tax=Solanum lycopersicum TaxID=4081 RepID=A0A3Q7G3W7_SOLLC
MDLGKRRCSCKRWEDLDINILVKILLSLDIFQLMYPLLWKTLDLSVLQSNFVIISTKPYVFCGHSSREKLETLIFHHNFYVDDNQLTYTANRYFPDKLLSFYNTI